MHAVPLSKLHQTQKRKNIALLLVLLALFALIFAISLMKMSAHNLS